MAFIQAIINPAALGFATRIDVIIPLDPRQPDREPATKILYLLHGLGGNSSDWVRKSRIEEYANNHNYIVIMPEVQRSMYANMKYGSAYLTYVTKELPQIVERLFNIKHTREHTYIAGLSMGGYGALKAGLNRPEFYAAAAGFSGVLDLPSHKGSHDAMGIVGQMKAIFGEDLYYPDEDNLFVLADKVHLLHEKPRLLITCGTEDALLADNHKFIKHLENLSIPYEYKEWTGEHTWQFWEESLPIMFAFFSKE